jgi:hypothetical protein
VVKDEKDEIMKAVEETANQNVLILDSIQNLRNAMLESHQATNTRFENIEQQIADMKSNHPVDIPRNPLPTFTNEEKREQALAVTKSINVQAESSKVIANTVRILPYITAFGMILAALVAGVMQYVAQHGH